MSSTLSRIVVALGGMVLISLGVNCGAAVASEENPAAVNVLVDFVSDARQHGYDGQVEDMMVPCTPVPESAPGSAR